eukprot:CAMPEP_0179084644 /NCGR_PEP_ID=MMETSP0796-20121207/38290_1 /TAXON_ID=73915 /ORGANISM="Pyrodinium bahamense, Strain pbaha01" /LENGTH=51 /DNA_ID=CAMNT_0020782069 /DNA_START=272 /DNA_END=427 /DNA_ORIENTATION=-
MMYAIDLGPWPLKSFDSVTKNTASSMCTAALCEETVTESGETAKAVLAKVR